MRAAPTSPRAAKQRETRYTVEERFSDFKTAEGLTLPDEIFDPLHRRTSERHDQVYEWDLTADEVSNNQPLDPKNFQVKWSSTSSPGGLVSWSCALV